MLYVHRRDDIDASVKDFQHALPSLGMPGAGDIGMRQLVYQHPLRFARDHGGGIHLLEGAAPVVELLAGNLLQSFGQFRDFGTPMRFDDADDHILAPAHAAMRFSEHGVGLPDAWRVAEEDFVLAALAEVVLK